MEIGDNHGVIASFVMRGELFAGIVNSISKIRKDTILEISKDGSWTVLAADISNICYVGVDVPRKSFTSIKKLSGDLYLPMSWIIPNKVLSIISKEERVIVEFKDYGDEERVMVIITYGGFRSVYKTERVSDVMRRPRRVGLKLPVDIEFDTSDIRRLISITGDDGEISFEYDEVGGFKSKLYLDGQEHEVFVKTYHVNKSNEQDNSAIRSFFSARYVKEIFSTLGNNAKLSLGQHKPVIFRDCIFDSAEITYMLAPVIRGR